MNKVRCYPSGHEIYEDTGLFLEKFMEKVSTPEEKLNGFEWSDHLDELYSLFYKKVKFDWHNLVYNLIKTIAEVTRKAEAKDKFDLLCLDYEKAGVTALGNLGLNSNPPKECTRVFFRVFGKNYKFFATESKRYGVEYRIETWTDGWVHIVGLGGTSIQGIDLLVTGCLQDNVLEIIKLLK